MANQLRDPKFEVSNKRLLSVVDNCSAQRINVYLKVINLLFLLLNTTAAL